MKLFYFRAGALARLEIPDALGEAWGVRDGDSVPTREAYQLRRLAPISENALDVLRAAERAANGEPDEPPALREEEWR